MDFVLRGIVVIRFLTSAGRTKYNEVSIQEGDEFDPFAAITRMRIMATGSFRKYGITRIEGINRIFPGRGSGVVRENSSSGKRFQDATRVFHPPDGTAVDQGPPV